MDFETIKLNNVQVVRIRTDKMTQDVLDDFRVQMLEMIEDNERLLLLNLDQVVYLDSFGVGVIMEIFRRLRSVGGDLKLCRLQPRVAKMVSITNLDSVLEIFEAEEAACASFEN